MKIEEKSGSTISVMVVDDNLQICQLLERVLAKDGYNVYTASNGLDAVKIAAQMHPHVILLDIIMPKMDGIETLRRLHQIGKRSTVIILTGHGSIDTAREAMLLGAHEYVSKPFDLGFLKNIIRECCLS